MHGKNEIEAQTRLSLFKQAIERIEKEIKSRFKDNHELLKSLELIKENNILTENALNESKDDEHTQHFAQAGKELLEELEQKTKVQNRNILALLKTDFNKIKNYYIAYLPKENLTSVLNNNPSQSMSHFSAGGNIAANQVYNDHRAPNNIFYQSAVTYGTHSPAYSIPSPSAGNTPQVENILAAVGKNNVLKLDKGTNMENPQAVQQQKRFDELIQKLGDNISTLIDKKNTANELIELCENDDKIFNKLKDHLNIVDKLIEIGKKEAEDEHLNEAIKYYNFAIKLYENDRYFNLRGNAKWDLGNLNGAIEDYDKAIKMNPNNKFYYENRGSVKYELLNYKGSIEDFSQAINIAPCSYYFNSRGNSKSSLNLHNEAIKDYDEAIRLDKKAIYFKNRSESYAALNQQEKARHDLEIYKLLNRDQQGAIMDNPQEVQKRQQQLPVVIAKHAASAQQQELTSNFMKADLFATNTLLLKEELQPVISVIYKKKQGELAKLLNQDRGLVLEDDEFGNIALHYAARVGDIKIIEELLHNDHRSNINESNQFGLQPIHIAAFFGHIQVVKYLLNRGAPPVTVAIKIPLRVIKTPIHCLPLHFAILNGQIETAIELIKSCKKEHLAQELRVQGLGNILHLAVLRRDLWALREIAYHPLVLENPELYNELNDDDLTPIALATAIKNNPAVKVLSQHRLINLNTLSKKIKRTVLHVAGEVGNDKAVEIVLGSVGDIQSAHSLIQISDTTPSHQTAYQVAFNRMNEIKNKEEKKDYRFTCNILNGLHLETFNQLRSKPTYSKPRIRNLVFQGGGPKGIAFIGALNALDQQLRDSDWSLNNIERVAGTSAGAITAAVLALGLTPSDIRDELASMDLAALLDGVEAEKLKAVITILNNFAQGGAVTLTGIADIALQVTKQVYDCSNDASAAYYLYTHRKELWEQFKGFTGLCSGQAFINWLDKVIEKWLRRILGQRIKDKEFGEEFVTSFTFGKLARLVDDRLLNCKHLYVVATCITGEPKDVIMSSEDPIWKDVRIVDAIRASMSIPGVFRPYQIDRFIDGKKISEEYLDGGMLMNAPVKLFDKVKYLKRYIHGDDDYEVFNEETLCLRLINNKSNEALKPTENFQKITTITEFLKQIINTFYEAEKIIGAAENKYQYRCIAIPDEGFGTLDFDIDEKGKKQLEESGIKTVGQFFNGYGQLTVGSSASIPVQIVDLSKSQAPALPAASTLVEQGMFGSKPKPKSSVENLSQTSKDKETLKQVFTKGQDHP